MEDHETSWEQIMREKVTGLWSQIVRAELQDAPLQDQYDYVVWWLRNLED